ncbi:MAG: hypothetical protein Q9162_003891 [Coniocarpon cinnabarinum]
MKFYESSFSHPYPFPTVTLAYYLRYPNPFSPHVLSTDVIDRHFDADTQTLYTARLHLKRSKVPTAILKLVPASWLGPSASRSGTSQSYILERSIVSIRDGVMVTESRNLELTGILSAVERQTYRRPGADVVSFVNRCASEARLDFVQPDFHGVIRQQDSDVEDDTTCVNTKVELLSRLGQLRERFRQARVVNGEKQLEEEDVADAAPAKVGFFKSWSTSSIQRSIEAIGVRRAERAVPKSKQGLEVVLSRLSKGGLRAVLDGMRRDREELMDG